MGYRDHRVHKEYQGHKVPKDLKVSRDLRDHKEYRGLKVSRDLRVCRVY
jgi:hypothetical protein